MEIWNIYSVERSLYFYCNCKDLLPIHRKLAELIDPYIEIQFKSIEESGEKLEVRFSVPFELKEITEATIYSKLNQQKKEPMAMAY